MTSTAASTVRTRGYDDISVGLNVSVSCSQLVGPLHEIRTEGYDPRVAREDTAQWRRGVLLGRRWVVGKARAIARTEALAAQHREIAGEAA